MDERNENTQPAFTASTAEKRTALFMYIAAYIYTLTTGSRWELWLTVFVVLFVMMAEYLYRNVSRSKESWVWLGCAVLVTACTAIGRSRAWGEFYSIAAVHILAVWWALSRGGKLIEGESGHLLPLDALNGFVRIPFGNFSLRLRCIGAWIKDMSRGRRSNKNTIIASLTAIVLGVLLLWWAASSLASADSGFGRIVSGVLDSLRINLGTGFWDFLFRLAVSLPVGAYVFGLIAGTARLPEEKLRTQRDGVDSFLSKLRVVPNGVWVAVTAAFAAVYLLFFIVQGSYLFGAFARRLPEGFIVSQYAREGFFELCRVIAINFTLLWLVTRSSSKPVRESRAAKLMCTLLLIAGALFAVISISKLCLYISCFGFTPLRLQSFWFALLMLCGCVCAEYSLWTGKKSFRFWMMFGAVTLSLLSVY